MKSVRAIEGAHLARSAHPQRDYQRREPGAVRRQVGAIVHTAAEAAVGGMAPLAGGAAPRQLRHLFAALALPRMAGTRARGRRHPPATGGAVRHEAVVADRHLLQHAADQHARRRRQLRRHLGVGAVDGGDAVAE